MPAGCTLWVSFWPVVNKPRYAMIFAMPAPFAVTIHHVTVSAFFVEDMWLAYCRAARYGGFTLRAGNVLQRLCLGPLCRFEMLLCLLLL